MKMNRNVNAPKAKMPGLTMPKDTLKYRLPPLKKSINVAQHKVTIKGSASKGL